MKVLLVIMTGIGFTLGVVLGLLLHLPSDSLPARHQQQQQQLRQSSLAAEDARLRRQAVVHPGYYDVVAVSRNRKISDGDGNPSSGMKAGDSNSNIVNGGAIPSLHLSHWNALQERKSLANKPSSNAKVNSEGELRNDAEKGGEKSWGRGKHGGEEVKVVRGLSEDSVVERRGDAQDSSVFNEGLGSKIRGEERRLKDFGGSNVGIGERVKTSSNNSSGKASAGSLSLEDKLYLSSIVNGIFWTDKVENACRKPFSSAETDAWRSRVQDLDVVKMDTGCGRMQNRLLTFRDASKACARYRLNTDQIQGDIFSYYLAKLLRIPNLPPTVLASVNSVDKKWRTVHLDLSLAQWADSKVVVLTKFIEGLKPAHIPKEFRDEKRQLHPVLAHLGTKSHSQICELLQWSDLIVFDYLTANLDRVINNMFNSQWNDQMMSSPTHNLEQFANGGGLVFLDNESGLFHGFRLIDKYEKLHRALLDSVCVFRSSTADVIKRLATSGSVGKELRALLESHEPLAKHVPSIPAKNVKILEKRIMQVYKQIVKCEQEFTR